MGYIDECLGYKEIKNKTFEEEFGEIFKEIKRYKLDEFIKPTYMIVCLEDEDNFKKRTYFFIQEDKRGDNVYRNIWVFDRLLTELQFKKFLMDANQEQRFGNEHYFFDDVVKCDEWIKSRFDGKDNYLYIYDVGKSDLTVKMALEKLENGNVKIYYKCIDEYGQRNYGNKELKNADIDIIKNYISKRINNFGNKYIIRNEMIVKMIKEELESDLELEKFNGEEKAKALECYGYRMKNINNYIDNENIEEKNIERREDINDKLKKKVLLTKERERLYILEKKDNGIKEIWLFKKDFNGKDAIEFEKQFKEWKERQREAKRFLNEKTSGWERLQYEKNNSICYNNIFSI